LLPNIRRHSASDAKRLLLKKLLMCLNNFHVFLLLMPLSISVASTVKASIFFA
jgi:hypothetical protein